MTSPLKRTDLLPYYGRLVATISQYSPELGKDLIVEVCLLSTCNHCRHLLE